MSFRPPQTLQIQIIPKIKAPTKTSDATKTTRDIQSETETSGLRLAEFVTRETGVMNVYFLLREQFICPSLLCPVAKITIPPTANSGTK